MVARLAWVFFPILFWTVTAGGGRWGVRRRQRATARQKEGETKSERRSAVVRVAISLLGESAPLTSCSVQVAICPEDEREEGEPMRD